MINIRQFAQTYLDHGWKIVPLAPKSKRVTKAGWIGLEFTPEDFRDGDNIGLRSVDGLVFVDLDSPECVAFGNAFLPDTPSVYGRPSKLRSKRIYKSAIPKTIAYKDADKTTLIELRSNHQDMAPPSEHPSGEVLSWESELGSPPEVEAAVLTRCVKLCATAAMIARHYATPGTRHDWTLALAGTLKRRGVSEEEMILLLQEAGHWSRDEKLTDRLREVSSTYAHSDEDPTTGATRLKELATGNLAESLITLWGASPAASDSAYLTNNRGEPIGANVSNLTLALTRLGVDLKFDDFAQKAFITYTSKFRGSSYSGLLEDPIADDLWIDLHEVENLKVPEKFFEKVVSAVARQSTFHPIFDYFKTLTWDGTPRIDTWLTTCAHAANTPYIRAVSSIVLIAAVRRVRQPGCKFDEMLILEQSVQGKNKSTGIKALCHNDNWFSDDFPLNVRSKELIERTAGKWIIEASELAGLNPRQNDTLKSMLSRQVDGPVRLAFGRFGVERPRSFILIGTTNELEYLSDLSGNRRFWPVSIKEIDMPWLKDNRDQLWAEACAREAKGESIRLDQSLWKAAGAEQSKRVFTHPWVEALADEYTTAEPGARVAPEEIWNLLGVPMDRRTSSGNRTVSDGMKSIGFKKISMRNTEGKVITGWGRD